MENTNNFFETWIEAQKTMSKNFAEMNEKLQKNMTGGEMMEKGSALYKEWLENQKSLLNNLMGQAAATTKDATDKAINTIPGAAYFENWFKMQNEAALRMMDTSRSLYENFAKSQNGITDAFNGAGTMSQNWMNSYNTLFGGMNKALTDMPKFMNPATAKEAFENMLKSTEMYSKMYEMWKPFFQNMPKGGFDAENMKKMFDPASYKEVIDQMFGFAPNNNLTALFEQASSYFTNLNSTARQMSDSFMNAFGKERELLEGLMPTGLGYATEMHRNFFNNFRQTMMPFFRISAPGNEQQQLDLLFETQEKLVNYSVKQNEMQYMIYTHAGKAWNNVMELLRTRSEENKEYANFQEFYAEWAEVNEKIFINLFSTEEFSRLQGELLSLGLDIKKGYEEQIEAALEPYPVVLRSHMDEVYRNNYDLRKEVRELQKTVKEMQQLIKIPAAKTTEAPAPKTAEAPIAKTAEAPIAETADNSKNGKAPIKK